MLNIIIILTKNIITINIQPLLLAISPTFFNFLNLQKKNPKNSSLVFVQLPY